MSDIPAAPITRSLGPFMEIIDYGGFYRIRNSKSKGLLGMIEFHHPWNQFVFTPSPGTLFSYECLEEIAKFLREVP